MRLTLALSVVPGFMPASLRGQTPLSRAAASFGPAPLTPEVYFCSTDASSSGMTRGRGTESVPGCTFSS